MKYRFRHIVHSARTGEYVASKYKTEGGALLLHWYGIGAKTIVPSISKILQITHLALSLYFCPILICNRHQYNAVYHQYGSEQVTPNTGIREKLNETKQISCVTVKCRNGTEAKLVMNYSFMVAG